MNGMSAASSKSQCSWCRRLDARLDVLAAARPKLVQARGAAGHPVDLAAEGGTRYCAWPPPTATHEGVSQTL